MGIFYRVANLIKDELGLKHDVNGSKSEIDTDREKEDPHLVKRLQQTIRRKANEFLLRVSSKMVEGFIHKTMPEIVADLISHPEMDGSKIEYLTEGPVTAEELKSLIPLPFEIAITERNGRLILSPLTWVKYGNHNRAYEDRQWTSKLFLHTHNRIPKEDSKIIVNTPSFEDIIIGIHCSDGTSRIVVHDKGITRFGPIIRDAVTDEPDNNAANIVRRYERHKGFSLHPLYATEAHPFLPDIHAFEEEIRLAREFALKTGMILDEADWDDEEGINRLLKTVNLED